MCLAQGPQRSDARTRGPSVSSQALYHCAPYSGVEPSMNIHEVKGLNIWATKLVFGVSDKAILKQVLSATETS